MSISTVNCQLSKFFHGCMQPSSPYHTSHLGDKVFPQPSSKVYTTSALERTFCRRGEKRRIFPCFNGRCRVTSRLQRQISATFKHQLRRLRECSLQLRPSSKTYLNSKPRCPQKQLLLSNFQLASCGLTLVPKNNDKTYLTVKCVCVWNI